MGSLASGPGDCDRALHTAVERAKVREGPWFLERERKLLPLVKKLAAPYAGRRRSCAGRRCVGECIFVFPCHLGPNGYCQALQRRVPDVRRNQSRSWDGCGGRGRRHRRGQRRGRRWHGRGRWERRCCCRGHVRCCGLNGSWRRRNGSCGWRDGSERGRWPSFCGHGGRGRCR